MQTIPSEPWGGGTTIFSLVFLNFQSPSLLYTPFLIDACFVFVTMSACYLSCLLCLTSVASVTFASALIDYSSDTLPDQGINSNVVDVYQNGLSTADQVATDAGTNLVLDDSLGPDNAASSFQQNSHPDSMTPTAGISYLAAQLPRSQVNSINKPNSFVAPDKETREELDKIKCPGFISNKLCCQGPEHHCVFGWCAFIDDCHQCMNLPQFLDMSYANLSIDISSVPRCSLSFLVYCCHKYMVSPSKPSWLFRTF